MSHVILARRASDGAIRELIKFEDFEDRAYILINEFFEGVKIVFGPEWTGMNPKTSRLRHGAGIVALGFVMELLYSSSEASDRVGFAEGLHLLKPYTAWTSARWLLSENDIRSWNGIQNTPGDIDLLSNYLVRSMKTALRRPRRVANG